MPYVWLVSTTCRSSTLGVALLSDPVPVRDQTAMRLSSDAVTLKMSFGPPLISSSVPLPGSGAVEGCIDAHSGRFASPVGTGPRSRWTNPTADELPSRLVRPSAYIWTPLKDSLASFSVSFVSMNTPSSLAPSSGWSGRHGQAVWTGVPSRPSSLVSILNRFHDPVGSLV